MAATSPPGYGLEESVGMAREQSGGTLTWATAVTPPTIFFRNATCSLMVRDIPVELSGPSGYVVPFTRASSTSARYFRPAYDVSGTITCEADYDTVGHLLQAVLGLSVGDTTSASNSHQFILNPSVNSSNPLSYTIYRQGGTVYDTGSNTAMQFVGCKCTSLELAGVGNRIVTATSSWVGRNATPTTATAVTMTTAPYIEFSDSVVKYNATVAGSPASLTGVTAATNWSIKFDSNLRVIPATGAGARYIREPIPQGYRKVTLRFDRDWYDETFYGARHPGEANHGSAFNSWSVVCTSLETQNSTAYSLTMAIPCGLMKSQLPEYGGGADIISETIEVEAGFDGTNAPFTATLVNDSVAVGAAIY